MTDYAVMITKDDVANIFDTISADSNEQVKKAVRKKYGEVECVVLTPIQEGDDIQTIHDRLKERYTRMMEGTKIKVPIPGVPQGSHRAFIVKNKQGMNRAVITDTNGNSLYNERIAIKTEYENAHGMKYDKTTPISLTVTFAYVKPKSASKKVRYKVTKPDTDKLVRGVLDSLTDVAYVDDSQVVEIKARKIFADSEYIEIEVNEYR